MMGGWFGFIILIIVIYILFTLRNETSTKKDTPLSILNKRYVNGELDDNEYLKMKKYIQDSSKQF